MKIDLESLLKKPLKCENPNCITNQPREEAKVKFYIKSTEPVILQCYYCERYLTEDKILKQIGQMVK
ncbi:MAG: hypothetical protein RMJ31_03470 [Nitrososphaerota archaeon]|nr:hypothetical protein [Nitrososphaerales archaeon]MCX8191699.1 hypothetical protein [Nitrososphaerales archaeon]MDW8044817.1 hypothetical protein [Nitrososphaerota archaeon]